MKKIKYSSNVIVFMSSAFIIPLLCIVLMTYVSCFKEGILQFVLYGIEAASPAIAAIIVIGKSGGLTGIKYFLYTKYRADFSIKMCLVGMAVPAVILTIAKILTYLTPYHNQFITPVTSKKIVIILWALVAEELGWRGYLQSRLEDKCKESITPIIIGIIWASWHYHFLLSGSMDVPIILLIVGCILESYGYYVITKMAKGNVVPASIWHFSGNLFFNLYLFNQSESIIPYAISTLMYIVYVGAFVYYRKRQQYDS